MIHRLLGSDYLISKIATRSLALGLAALVLGACARPALAKTECASLEVVVASDPMAPPAMISHFKKRVDLLFFALAKARRGSACHLDISIKHVASMISIQPGALDLGPPRDGTGRAKFSARLTRGGVTVWSGEAEHVYRQWAESVATAELLQPMFDHVRFDGALDPFDHANAKAIHANLCALASPRPIPSQLKGPVRIIRHESLSSEETPCKECWSLLGPESGVHKVLLDPLGPDADDYEAAYGPGGRAQYLLRLQESLNIADRLIGEPVLLSVIGLDADRVPILHAEPAGDIKPDASLTFDDMGFNLGMNTSPGPGIGAGTIDILTFKDLRPGGVEETTSTAYYKDGLGSANCSPERLGNWPGVFSQIGVLNSTFEDK